MSTTKLDWNNRIDQNVQCRSNIKPVLYTLRAQSGYESRINQENNANKVFQARISNKQNKTESIDVICLLTFYRAPLVHKL